MLAGKSLKAFQFVSVCSHFKKQLTELMALLNQLEPHYVRCIKPNPGSKPLLLDDLYALHQLKCGGVMEAVRISCAGVLQGGRALMWWLLTTGPGTSVDTLVAMRCSAVRSCLIRRHNSIFMAVCTMRCTRFEPHSPTGG